MILILWNASPLGGGDNDSHSHTIENFRNSY